MKPIIRDKVEKITFDNGFRLLLEQRPSLNSVAANLMFEAGSIHENERNNGVAHFLEHTVFKGSKRFPGERTVVNSVREWGGYMNAITTRETTEFFFVVPSDRSKRAFTVFTDVIMRPLLQPEEIEKERNVIISEIKTRDEDNFFVVGDAWMKNMFRGSSLSLDPGGSDQTVGGITRSDIVAFKESMYGTRNTVMSVVGRFDRNAVVDHVEKTLGRQPELGMDVGVHDVKVPVPELHQRREVAQLHILMGTTAVQSIHPDAAALSLTASYLSEWLFHNIREKRGLAYTVEARFLPTKNVGTFTIYSNIKPTNFAQVDDIIVKEINKIARSGVPLDEIKRLKKRVSGDLILSMEDNTRQARYLCIDELAKRFDLVDWRTAQLMRVTTADTKRVAKKYLDPENFLVATVGPK